MQITLLDAHTANPGDLSWSPLQAIGTCHIFDRTTQDETIERCKDSDVIITNKSVVNRQMIESLPGLRYIGVTATGYNVVDVVAAKERGITVTNVPGYSTPSVAQAVFALLLELTNHVGHHADTVRKGRWSACPDFCYWDHPIIELSGRTLGIIGYGDIGAAVARIALAFGMKILASRRHWPVQPPAGIHPATHEEIFMQSDVISLHCPLTQETQHLINTRTLSLMKANALLINTGRGPLIDDAALASALNDGLIAGAGLDVLSAEPPPGGNPLFTAKNCLITPHIAWASRESRARLIQITADNLLAWQAGKPQNVVS